MSHHITGQSRLMAADHRALGRGACMPSINFGVPIGEPVAPRGTKAEYTRTRLRVYRGLNDHDHVRFLRTDYDQGGRALYTFAMATHWVTCIESRRAHTRPPQIIARPTLTQYERNVVLFSIQTANGAGARRSVDRVEC